MHSISRRRGVRQFVKFGIVGASGTVVNFIVAHGCEKLGVPGAGAFALGFMSGGISNWYLNRVWTFRSSGHPGREAVQFLTVSALSLCAGELVFLWHPFGRHFTRTWVLATAAGVFVNFFLNKYWTFKDAA